MMILRTKKAKIFFTAVLLVLALTLIMPTVASAAITRHIYVPWRGGFLNWFVYGRAYNTADCNYHWMEVHCENWIKSGDTFLKMNEKITGGNDIDYLYSQSYWYTGPYQFNCQTRSFHEWDIDGESYCAEAKESGILLL